MNNYIKTSNLTLQAKNASPNPPVGPIIGQLGLNIRDFCTNFNNLSAEFEKGVLLSVTILIKKDNSFDLKINNVNSVFLIKNLLEQNALSPLNIYKLILIKQKEAPFLSQQSLFNIILSTFKSMKINKFI